MQGQPDGEKELENTCHALRVFAEADVPIARQRFWGDTFEYLMTRYSSVHRGGYTSRGESRAATENPPATPTMETARRMVETFYRSLRSTRTYCR